MKRFTKNKKVLFGLSVSLVLAMAIGSFAIGEAQTPVTPQATTANDSETGDFVVSGGSYGTSNDYDFDTAGRVLYIHPQDAETKITISTGSSTTDRIEITSAATIILAGVEIDRSSITATAEPAALTITDDATFNVNILLKDNTKNILKGAAGSSASPSISGSPGIQKNGDTNVGTLTITGSTGENAGKLEATGGYRSAGIGGGNQGSVSNITISGGEVTTTGGYHGAGIGGGDGNGENGNGTKITISSGIVKATGGARGAGIGGGAQGTGSDITISGGKVEAYAGDYDSNSGDSDNFLGAGIGGGTL